MNRCFPKKVIAVILAFTLATQIEAAGYPVIDIENLIAAIEEGYQMYNQLQALYTQITTAYDQLQATKDSMANLDIGKLDASDPLGSYRNIMTYGNRLMNYERNAENLLTQQTYTWGSTKFSLTDLFQKDKMKTLLTDSWQDPFERKMTTEEKARFNEKYGMSYGNYMRYYALNKVMNEAAGNVYAYATNQIKNVSDDRERIETIASTDTGNSFVKNQETQKFLLLDMCEQLKTMTTVLSQTSSTIAAKTAMEDIEKEEIEKQKRLKPAMTKAYQKYRDSIDDSNLE